MTTVISPDGLYSDDRYRVMIPFELNSELNLATGTALFTITLPYAVTVRAIGLRVTTQFNSTADAVLALDTSADVEKTTLNVPTGTAAGTMYWRNASSAYTDLGVRTINFTDGIIKVRLKTAASTAGKGYLLLILNEYYA